MSTSLTASFLCKSNNGTTYQALLDFLLTGKLAKITMVQSADSFAGQ